MRLSDKPCAFRAGMPLGGTRSALPVCRRRIADDPAIVQGLLARGGNAAIGAESNQRMHRPASIAPAGRPAFLRIDDTTQFPRASSVRIRVLRGEPAGTVGVDKLKEMELRRTHMEDEFMDEASVAVVGVCGASVVCNTLWEAISDSRALIDSGVATLQSRLGEHMGRAVARLGVAPSKLGAVPASGLGARWPKQYTAPHHPSFAAGKAAAVRAGLRAEVPEVRAVPWLASIGVCMIAAFAVCFRMLGLPALGWRHRPLPFQAWCHWHRLLGVGRLVGGWVDGANCHPDARPWVIGAM